MVNQTTEILIGISEQTGMQLNDLVNYMAQYTYMKSQLHLICYGIDIALVIILIICSIKLLSAEDELDFNEFGDRTLFITISAAICMMLFMVMVFFSDFICNAILGMMFPKQEFIQQIINSIL